MSEEPTPHDHGESIAAPPDLPPGWKYRQRRIFGFNIPWYASPSVQLLLVAFVCFMCPGMFNALVGLGGGGKTDATLADNMVRQTGLDCIKNDIDNLDRIRLCTVLLQSLASSVVLLSTSSVSDGRSHLEGLDTASTPSACWSPFTPALPASISSLGHGSVFVPVFCGPLKGPS